MTEFNILNDNNRDDHVDKEILSCYMKKPYNSFFVFAGAGSGKTRSLVKLLLGLRELNGGPYKRKGKKIAVITYTNAACDEIMRRVEYDSLFSISTIHSFVWNLINPYQKDIKEWITNKIAITLDDLKDKQSRSRDLNNPTSRERQRKIDKAYLRLEVIRDIKYFVYNPNGDNTTVDSLSHSEVIEMGKDFLFNKPLLKKILIKSYPIILIDESQDTKKELMEAFLQIQKEYSQDFSIGLFGDMMQRIYADGKSDLLEEINCRGDDWLKTEKIMNHRCCKRIVELINRIRLDVDGLQQKPRTDKDVGKVHLFVTTPSDNKGMVEDKAAKRMIEITENIGWENDFEKLILEHHMAARRLKFNELFEPLYEIDRYKNSILDGTLTELSFFTNIVLPLVNAGERNDQFEIMRLLKEYSPMLKNLDTKLSKETLLQIKCSVEKLLHLWKNGNNPSCYEVLRTICEEGIVDIPPLLREVAFDSIELPDDDEIISVWRRVIKVPFSQIASYDKYINDKSGFMTHQGVKGLEFPRVMVIIDDSEAKGFMFSYEKLFGVKDKTQTDIKNENEGKDTSILRTKRLFYVACSRAEEDLAIVIYTQSPQIVKKRVLAEEWFLENEIEII